MEAKERYIIHRSFGELKQRTGMDNMQGHGHKLTPDFSATKTEVAAHPVARVSDHFTGTTIEELDRWMVDHREQAMRDTFDSLVNEGLFFGS